MNTVIADCSNGFSIQDILALGAILWWFKIQMDAKFKSIEDRLDQQIEQLNAKIEEDDKRIEEAKRRSDQLSSMSVDLLKDKR